MLLFLFFLLSLIIFYITSKGKNWFIIDYPSNESSKINKNKVKTSLGIVFLALLTFYQSVNFFTIDNYEKLLSNEVIFLSSVFFFTLIGAMDDIIEVNNFIKLFSIVIISIILCMELFININIFYLIIIIFLIISFIISVNLIDGANGFLIQYSIFFILNFCSIIFFNPEIMLNNFQISLISSFFILNLIFIFYNLKGKVFIGNSGSMLTSIFLTYLLFILLKNKLFFEIIILISYPTLDIGITFLKKISKNISLYKKDFFFFFLNPIKNNNKKHLYVFIQFLYYNIFNSIILIAGQYLNIIFGAIISLIISLGLIYKYGKKNSL